MFGCPTLADVIADRNVHGTYSIALIVDDPIPVNQSLIRSLDRLRSAQSGRPRSANTYSDHQFDFIGELVHEQDGRSFAQMGPRGPNDAGRRDTTREERARRGVLQSAVVRASARAADRLGWRGTTQEPQPARLLGQHWGCCSDGVVARQRIRAEPVEYLWAWLKRYALANYCARSLAALKSTARGKKPRSG